MTDQEFNSVKEKFSKAYLYAVSAKVNYAVEENTRDFDGLGIDFTLANKTVGTKRTVSSVINVLNIQLKGVSASSVSMIRENETHIDYKLGSDLVPVGNHYLVIVHLPTEEKIEEWLEIDKDKLILRKCAYFLKIDKPLKSGFVKIPKSNLFIPEILPSLFLTSINKEDNL